MSKKLGYGVLMGIGISAATYLAVVQDKDGVGEATAVAAEPYIHFVEGPVPEGLDDALEDRSARFFYCPDAGPRAAAQLAYDISKKPDQIPTLTKARGCTPYTDPTSWSGPMLSMEARYGDVQAHDGIKFIAGRFTMGNPAGSGGSGEGVAVWRSTAAVASAGHGLPDLTNNIKFDDPKSCGLGAYLGSIIEQVSMEEPLQAGPLSAAPIKDVVVEDFHYKTLSYDRPFMWQGLQVKSFRMDFEGLGFWSVTMNFSHPIGSVRPKLKALGFKVFDDGRAYEFEDEEISYATGTTLEPKGSGAEFSCNSSI